MAKVQRAVTLCAATEDILHDEKNVWNAANANFIGVVLFNVKNVTEK